MYGYLSQGVAGENVCALICPEDEAQQVFVSAVLAKILAEENAALRETYFFPLAGSSLF